MWSSDRHHHHRCRDRQDALPEGFVTGPSPAGDMPLRAGGCETLLQMDLGLRVPRSGGPSSSPTFEKAQDGGGHGLCGLKGIPSGPCHALCVMARPRSGEGRRSDASHQGRSPWRSLRGIGPENISHPRKVTNRPRTPEGRTSGYRRPPLSLTEPRELRRPRRSQTGQAGAPGLAPAPAGRLPGPMHHMGAEP